jgi:uncharacterized protein (DUF927 family)
MLDTATLFEPLSSQELAGADGAPPRPGATPIIPVPDCAPPMRFRHPKLSEPTCSWPYYDAEGRLVCYICRWDFINDDGEPDKLIHPVAYCDLGAGRSGWRAKGIPAPRPLLRLPELLTRPEAWVLVCEGEKAADAAAQLFPDMVATTPMHGAKSPHLSDWRPCAGRTVVISTDNDETGRAFGEAVCALARAAGAAQVLHLDPQRLGIWLWRNGAREPRGEPVPIGWDLADAIAEGWTAEAVAACKAEPGLLVPYPDPGIGAGTEPFGDRHAAAGDAGQPNSAAHSGRFRVGPDGVHRRVGNEDETDWWEWLCSLLEVVAETRDADGENWGRLLRITDRDGKVKEWSMPMELFAGSGDDYRGRLLSLGLVLSPAHGARQALAEYIQTARPGGKARCVSRIGWHARAFVLPDITLGQIGDERVLLQTSTSLDHAFGVRGSLHGWQERVAQLAIGNSRLVHALSAAFAGPLLQPSGTESGGFHYRGPSSTGKTTALLVAGSVWGGGGLKGYLRQWRATDNGLEAVAAAHCDGLLCLDELSQVDPKAAGASAYMLANGAGKARAGRNGEGRHAREWRVLFLSSGEIGLDDKLAEDGRGRRETAGQQVRVIDVPADGGAGLGLFEDLHSVACADAFARQLKIASTEEYGTAGRAFLEEVKRDPEGIIAAVRTHQNEFIAEYCPAGADGQVKRVAARFGLTRRLARSPPLPTCCRGPLARRHGAWGGASVTG